jgi:hypothetical protein
MTTVELDETVLTDGDFTALTLGSLTDGQAIRRSGSSLLSSAVRASSWPIAHHAGTTNITIWFTGAIGNSAYGTGAQPKNVMRAYPFILPATRTADRIGFEVTAFAANTSGRAAIYQATSATNIYPSTLILDDGGSVTNAANQVNSTNINQVLTGGVVYWFATVMGNTVGANGATCRALDLLPACSIGCPAPPPIVNGFYLTVTQTYGALGAFPAGATIGSTTSVCPVVGLRFSA